MPAWTPAGWVCRSRTRQRFRKDHKRRRGRS
jgi:hypothetical protein